MRQRRLQWFAPVRREMEGKVLRVVEEMEIPGRRPAGRLRRTRRRTEQRDMEELNIEERLALDPIRWRRSMGSLTPSIKEDAL